MDDTVTITCAGATIGNELSIGTSLSNIAAGGIIAQNDDADGSFVVVALPQNMEVEEESISRSVTIRTAELTITYTPKVNIIQFETVIKLASGSIFAYYDGSLFTMKITKVEDRPDVTARIVLGIGKTLIAGTEYKLFIRINNGPGIPLVVKPACNDLNPVSCGINYEYTVQGGTQQRRVAEIIGMSSVKLTGGSTKGQVASLRFYNGGGSVCSKIQVNLTPFGITNWSQPSYSVARIVDQILIITFDFPVHQSFAVNISPSDGRIPAGEYRLEYDTTAVGGIVLPVNGDIVVS